MNKIPGIIHDHSQRNMHNLDDECEHNALGFADHNETIFADKRTATFCSVLSS